MKDRALAKRALPWVITSISGFAVAYLVVWFFAFPSEVLPDDGRVPRVVGMNFEEAESVLEDAGFRALRGQVRFHSTPAEVVLEQDPAAGTLQRRGATVTLAVSGGQETAIVPEVRGATQQQARVMIETAGLTFGSVSHETNPDPRGAVIRSDPPAGTTVSLPATVSITVSQGPASVHLPDFTGRSLSDARSLIEQLGLVLGGVTRDTSSFLLENTVIGQAPIAGSTISAGSSVNLRISYFPPLPGATPPPAVSPAPRDTGRLDGGLR